MSIFFIFHFSLFRSQYFSVQKLLHTFYWSRHDSSCLYFIFFSTCIELAVVMRVFPVLNVLFVYNFLTKCHASAPKGTKHVLSKQRGDACIFTHEVYKLWKISVVLYDVNDYNTCYNGVRRLGYIKLIVWVNDNIDNDDDDDDDIAHPDLSA